MRNQVGGSDGRVRSGQSEPTYCCDGSSPDDIVITGIAGRFPMSNNIEEFKENLYNKVDFFTSSEERWRKGLCNLPETNAFCQNVDKFDNEFFGIPASVANSIEPEQRMLLEVCYEAVTDAGYDPQSIRGRDISLYTANSNRDARDLVLFNNDLAAIKSHGFMNSFKSCRCSLLMGLKGPSGVIDTACSSSLAALDIAVGDVKSGRSEAAIVCGCHLVFFPGVNTGYTASGILSPTGRSRAFDISGDGMARADGLAAIFIQKASAARRMYAKIAGLVTMSAGYVPEGIYVPNKDAEVDLFRRTVASAKTDPLEILYVEAHGTGTTANDPAEAEAVAKVFCQKRKEPLLIGSSKSNVGHSEAAAGLIGIIKSILVFETGLIAPNQYFTQPTPKSPALKAGRLKVVSEVTPFHGTVIAVNSFGFGGIIGQTILRRNELVPSDERHAEHLPQLVLCAATCEEGVRHALEKAFKTRPNREFFALFHEIAASSPKCKPYRGYAILNEKKTLKIKTHNWKVCYVMTGMGWEYSSVAQDFMKIEAFKDSICQSAKELEPYGIDLVTLLHQNKDSRSQKNTVLAECVITCAVQLAVLDVLHKLGISPDHIIGYSVGEIASAYADGCCTAKEAIMCAYWWGKCIQDANLAAGAVAVVGLSWEVVKKKCPRSVYPTCHNAKNSVTISGSRGMLEKFVEELKSENEFPFTINENVSSSAFHSKLAESAATVLKSSLDKVFVNPKARTKRWHSTSYSPEEWAKPASQTADASYFAHNLSSNVHFAEAVAHIPEDAVIIEIGPRTMLQTFGKHATGQSAGYVSLTNFKENVNSVLSTIGEMYTLGLNPEIRSLYPVVNYPVPRGTPCLSDFIKWNHRVSWKFAKYVKETGGTLQLTVRPDGADSYLLDHFIDGRSLFPATGYVYLAWQALSKFLGISIEKLPIVLEEFRINRATILTPSDAKIFIISIAAFGGDFEIIEGSTVVATGKITYDSNLSVDMLSRVSDSKPIFLDGREVYGELKIRGYEYGPAFRCLDQMSIDGTCGFVKWTESWIPYLDAHLLFFGLMDDSATFALPTKALSIKINPSETMKYAKGMGSTSAIKSLPVIYDRYAGICSSPGVEIRGLKLDAAPRRQTVENAPVLEKCEFVPYFLSSVPDIEKQKLVDYISVCSNLAEKISSTFAKVSSSKANITEVLDAKIAEYLQLPDENHILLNVLHNISTLTKTSDFLAQAASMFKSYVDNVGNDLMYKSLLDPYHLRIITEIIVENSSIRLSAVEVSNGQFPILPEVMDIVAKFARVKINGVFLSENPNTLDQDTFTVRKIQVSGMQSGSTITSKDIAISSFFFGDAAALKSHVSSLSSMTAHKGFILFLHRHQISPAEAFLQSLCKQRLNTQSSDTVESIFKSLSLTVICKYSDSFGCTLYLLRRDHQEQSYTDSIVHVKDECYTDWVEQLRDAVNAAAGKDGARIWLVAEDSPYNGLIGMAKCLWQEHGKKIRCVFIGKDQVSGKVPPFNLSDSFYADILKRDLVFNVYLKGVWGSLRHISIKQGVEEKKVEHSFMSMLKYGDLSSFRWMESPCKYGRDELGSSENSDPLIHVVYSALNFRDLMYATAKISPGVAKDDFGNDPCVIGGEFSGITSDGRRIMGLAFNRCIATTIHRTPLCSMEVPDYLTLEEAATIPCVYVTCYYALIMRARLTEGESILIHSGAGGVGLAAIRLAQSVGCEIFTTVGTPEKREYLKKQFPQLKDENIGCSRDTSFEQMIKQQTNGRGVDVVLNSLADDKLQAGIRCLAKNGRFVEIGKYDLMIDNKIGLGLFQKNATFHGVFLDVMKDFATSSLGHKIAEAVENGLKSGVVQPLNRTVFSSDEVESAFRFMGTGKHIGKVLLKIREEPERGVIPRPLERFAMPYVYFYRHKVYIIIGGLGGFGMQLAQWMIGRGAVNIILTSRSGIRNTYQRMYQNRWKRFGANVVVSLLNVAIEEEAKKLLHEATRIGPVGGIFNSAVVLKDAFMENQTAKSFVEACAPKAAATKHLDKLSRQLCPSLDHFVCFSSISCGKGNAGQTNYGYANSVMERVCEKRHENGLPGLAIQWGIIGDVGVVHRQMGDDAMIAGVMAQRIKSCLETLEQFMLQDNTVVSSYVNASNVDKFSKDDTLTQLARILGCTSASELNTAKTFQETGVDSMIATEILQFLEMNYDISLPAKELLYLKIGDLKELVESKGQKNPKTNKLGEDDMLITKKTVTLIPETTVINLNKQTSGIPIFFVHYSDYVVKKVCNIANELENPCFGLVCAWEVPVDSIKALSQFYLKQISNYSSKPVHLVGIGDAASLAFEMANMSVTSSGFPNVKTLIILDGAAQLASVLNGDIDLHSVNEKDDLMEYGLYFIDQSYKSTLSQGILHITPETFGNVLSTFVECDVSKNKMNEAALRYLKLKNLMRSYKPSAKYTNNIAAVEAAGKLLANDTIQVKSAISKFCSGQVIIHRILGGEEFLAEKESAEAIIGCMKTILTV